jgi:hypothetical protein
MFVVIHRLTLEAIRNQVSSESINKRLSPLSPVCFNGNHAWKLVHRPSSLGNYNVDAARPHTPGLAETPQCIPVTA